jgi:hypothetical protein
MKSSLLSLLLAVGIVSAQAGDTIFTSSSLGKSILQSNERLARNWFFEVTGGPVFGVNGDLTHSTSSLGGVNLEALNFDDLYGNAGLLGMRLGRAVGLNDVYFRFAYTQADGGTIRAGQDGTASILAEFGDYSDFAFLGGIRRQFMQPSRLHPYLGFETGIRSVDAIDANLYVPSYGRTGNVPFYDESTVFTAEVTVGISYDLTDAFRIGFESGLRYQGGLDEIDTGVLSDFNNGDSLLFIPLMLTGTMSF